MVSRGKFFLMVSDTQRGARCAVPFGHAGVGAAKLPAVAVSAWHGSGRQIEETGTSALFRAARSFATSKAKRCGIQCSRQL
jgi:hypothetical protein